MDLHTHPYRLLWYSSLAAVIRVLATGRPKRRRMLAYETIWERLDSDGERKYRNQLGTALELGVILGLLGLKGPRYHVTDDLLSRLKLLGDQATDVAATEKLVAQRADPVGEPPGPYFDEPPRLEIVERAILKIVREHEVPIRKRRDSVPDDNLRKLLIHFDRITAESPLLMGVAPTIGISFNGLAAKIETEFPGITVGDFVVVLERHLTDHRPDLKKNDREKAMQLASCPDGGGDVADAVESLLEQKLLRVELRITGRQEKSWVVLRIAERATKEVEPEKISRRKAAKLMAEWLGIKPDPGRISKEIKSGKINLTADGRLTRGNLALRAVEIAKRRPAPKSGKGLTCPKCGRETHKLVGAAKTCDDCFAKHLGIDN